MKFSNLMRKKKYFYKIFLVFTIAIFIIISVFSFVIYYSIENSVLRNEYEHNKKLLYQMKYNIDSMNETARNLCMFVYYNTDTKAIMFSKSEDENFNDFMKSLIRISDIPAAIPFIESVYIYNNNMKTYYSTGGVFNDESIKRNMLGLYKGVPVLKPIMRKVVNIGKASDEDDYVFSYFMYDSKDISNYMDGGVILNVKPEWLYDNINLLNIYGNSKQDKVFIVDDRGGFIEDKRDESKIGLPLNEIYNSCKGNINDSQQNAGFLKVNLESKEFIITYIKLENTDWIIMKAQPYSEVFKYIYQLKTGLIILTVVFFILALTVAIFISRGVYRPIGKLVKQLDTPQVKKIELCDTDDEIFYLNEVYKYSMDRLTQFTEERNSNRSIMKDYVLKNLLIDSVSIDEDEFKKNKEDFSISAALDKCMAVCIIKIDNLIEFEADYSSSDKSLIKFAIINITTEILSGSYKNEAVDMNGNHIAVILDVEAGDTDFQDNLIKLIRQAQEYIYKHYKISITVAMSELIESKTELTKYYNQTLNYIAYRWVFGKMSVLNYSKVRDNMNNINFDYNALVEKRLVEDIRTANIERIEDGLLAIFNEISKLNYNNMVLALMNLLNTIKNTVDEINYRKLDTTNINFEFLVQQLYEMETLDELRLKLMDIFNNLPEGAKKNKSEKHEVIVETIKSIIFKNFSNSNLCLQEIASMLKLSPQYVSRIFRENAGMSVSEYINEIRLNKVIELLKNTKLNIIQILEKVGIDNETYFYRIFKKKFGTTPREYVMKITGNELKD